jgi:hypothetical protein
MPLPAGFWDENLAYKGVLEVQSIIHANTKGSGVLGIRKPESQFTLDLLHGGALRVLVAWALTDGAGLPWTDDSTREFVFRKVDSLSVIDSDGEGPVLRLELEGSYWRVIGWGDTPEAITG